MAINVPRLDYQMSACPSVLVEPAATNGILNSQDSSTSWTTGANLSSSLSVVQGVNGRELEVTTAGSGLGVVAGRHQRSSLSFNLVSGSTYTISFIVKRTSTHSIFGYYALATNDLGGGFDVSNLTTGALYSNAAFDSRARRITPLGNEEFLCEETFTMTAARTLTSFSVAPVVGVTNTNNPSVNSRIAFAAPQIELGAVATSRIFTVATAITRNADAISLASASGLIGQTDGTIYAEVNLRANAAERRIISVTSGAEANRIIIWTLGTTLFVTFNAATSINLGAFPIGALKIAVGYTISGGSTTHSISRNGAAVVTGTSATAPTGLNQINLGSNTTSSLLLNDRMSASAIYTSRLSNAELASMTVL